MGKGRRSSERALQKVLGQDADVNAANPLEVHDPKVGSLISYEGVTTADGAGAGTTLIDSVLTSKPDFNGNLVIITSGAYAGQARDINGVTTGGTVSPHLAFGGQILRGTNFVIAAIRLTPAEVAALTTMVQTAQYHDRVFFNSTTGIAGIAWPVGTPQVPSDVIADVITILAARNLRIIDVHGTLTLGAAMNHIDFLGHLHEAVTDIVDLNTHDVDNSHFKELIITGAQAGAGLATYKKCLLLNMTGFRGMARDCAIFGTLAVATGNADYADFDHCTSVHGVITVTIAAPDRVSFKEFSGGLILTAQTGGNTFVRGISGYLEVDAMTGGTLDIYAHGAEIQINANCDAPSVINIYGDARVTIVGAPTATVNDYTKETQLDTVEGKVDDIIPTVAGLNIFEGTVTANWNTAFATSLEGGEDLLGGASAQGAIPGITLLHSLLLDVSALSDGAKIHVKLFIKVNDNEKKVYDQEFTVPTTVGVETPPPDTDALWIVNGTVAVHDDMRVEVYSDTDEDVAIGYTYATGAILP
ncbi:hypothetical protein ES703_23076 [subsurface metagenome]